MQQTFPAVVFVSSGVVSEGQHSALSVLPGASKGEKSVTNSIVITHAHKAQLSEGMAGISFLNR
ncbi:MAG TPA: hypothetical protein VG675_25130 [Bryobacteraceae bacterium]|nr:hypothetical protein [Bryobacteraceae bacterium]